MKKKANPVHIIYCHVDRKPVYVTECHVDRKKNLVADRVATSLINCTHSAGVSGLRCPRWADS